MSAAAIADAMRKAGCSVEQIVAALKEYEEGKRAKGRASNARRQAEFRARRNESNESNAHNGVTESNENNGVTHVTGVTENDIPRVRVLYGEENSIINKTSNDVLQKAAPRVGKGSRITGCWAPDSADWHFAIAELGGEGADRELAKFRDYWIGKPGAGGLKLDWQATWRNWVRKAADDRKARAGPRAGPPTSKATQLSQALRAAERFKNEQRYDTSPNLVIDVAAIAREA